MGVQDLPREWGGGNFVLSLGELHATKRHGARGRSMHALDMRVRGNALPIIFLMRCILMPLEIYFDKILT